MSDTTKDHFEFYNGDLRFWVTPDRGSLMIKSVTKHGDPVELGENEVEILIGKLQEMLQLFK